MMTTIFSILFVVLLFGFVSWRKYEAHKTPKKYWEGRNPNEQEKSTEELEQNENKYRGFGQIGGGMGGM